MISIVVPFFNQWSLTHARLAEFYKFIFNKYDIEIILINDASTETDCALGSAFWQGVFNREKKVLRYHENKENGGFGYSMNEGMKLAKGDIFVLYSNDVVMGGDWLGSALNLVGDSHQNVLLGGEVVNYPAGWNQFKDNDPSSFIPYANGWLLAFRREMYDEGIRFDEIYYPYDFDDVDLSTQAILAGYKLVALNSPFLKHLGGATIWPLNPHRQETTQKHRILFIEKWYNRFEDVYGRIKNEKR